MEGSESEAIFEKLMGVKPRIFINEVLNSVDDLLDEAFLFFHQQASAVIKTEVTATDQDLSTGVAYLQKMIQSALDKKLEMWEKYSLHHCFSVPEGFSLPESDNPSCVILPSVDALEDFELEEQLDSLRNRVSQVRKESLELNKELQALERQSTSTDYIARSITEAVELVNQSSLHDTFHEMMTTADELRSKIVELQTDGMELSQRNKIIRLDNQNSGVSVSGHSDVLEKMNLDDLRSFLVESKNNYDDFSL